MRPEKGIALLIHQPVAEAVFYRGQQPICAVIGDTVENDLQGTIQFIREGWQVWRQDRPRWAMVLLDLCFYTGRVTKESEMRRGPGFPEGRYGDVDPNSYFGLKILKAIHDQFPDLPVIILSNKPADPFFRECSSNGALDFLPREGDQEQPSCRIFFTVMDSFRDDTGEIIGHSKSLVMALRQARRLGLGLRPRNILIRGVERDGQRIDGTLFTSSRENNRVSAFCSCKFRPTVARTVAKRIVRL